MKKSRVNGGGNQRQKWRIASENSRRAFSMVTIPKMSDREIISWVDEKSFGRGKRYFENGTIFDARKVGMTLKANCEGSRAASYRLQVTFNNKGITVASCSCPVGGGGHCKHIAALLLTWRVYPEEFIELPEIDSMLKSRSKDELVTFIKQMLAQQPELESFAGVYFSQGNSKHASFDPKVYKCQADAIFRRSRHEWHGELSLAHELSAIKKIGEKFAETKDYSRAYAVYAGVSSSVIENLEIFHDEEGYLNEVVQECVNGLGLCLKNEKNGNIREKILNSIFKIFASDIDDFGGIGLSDEIPELVVQHTTDNERKMVIDWIRHKMSKANGWSHEVYIEFLQDLEK